MTREEARIKIEKLKKKIQEANYQYFVLDKSEISEGVRDALKRELRNLEAQYPEFITSDSPTQRVGSVLSGKFSKVRHVSKKWSLQDVFNEEELGEWIERLEKLLPHEEMTFIGELKIDGLNITLHYEKGQLVRAITRGDGEMGEDVTHTVRTIEAIPLSLTEKVDVEVSGEVFISKKVFEAINRECAARGDEPFANPRNAAAGTVRQLDPAVAARRELQAYMYELGANTLSVEPKTQKETLLKFESLGLPISKRFSTLNSEEAILHYRSEIKQERDRLPFEIDGIVVKVNEKDLWSRLGFTAKAPRYAIAYKFAAVQSTSKIFDIQVQVGRTGALTPVAILQPTEVAGVTVSRATLHNEDEIQRKDVRIGDTVIIQRAGDVIPEVVEVLKDLRTGHEKIFHFPKYCPVCASPVERKDGEVAYRCINRECFAQKSERLSHFVSRDAMNIDGLGEKVIIQLLEQGLIQDPSDLYTLTGDDLLPLPLFKEKKTKNILTSLEKSKNVTLDRLIFALGIRYLGEQGSSEFAQYIIAKAETKNENHANSASHIKNLTIDDFLKITSNLTIEELSNIEGIGEKVAESIFDFFQKTRNIELIKRLGNAGVKIQIEHHEKSPLAGKSFVITGTMENMSREEAKQKIKSLGGKLLSAITHDTDFLVVGSDPGSKLKKAQELNIKLLSEKEFLHMIR